jgi:hypothetical protein
VGITKERVEELLSRKGICTGDIGAIDFLADLFGTNFEAALTAMAEKGKMSHVRKITDGNGVNKVTHYIIKSNEAFKGEYNTKKDNEAGENFEVFIKDAFKGIHFEKEKRDPSNMNTISGIPGIGYWEDPNTKNSWIHRDVDVFMGKKNTIEVTLSTTSDGKQVEAIDTDGNSKTRDVDSSFVEVKAGQVDWNLLKDKSDGSPGELSRGNLIAIKYTASYNILISKTNFTLRPELEKMMARYGMTWILILNENGYIAFPKD